MESAIFHGLGTAIVTPFRSDESVDHASLEKLVEFQVAGGVDFLVACGSTGEASALSEDETDAVVRTVIQAAAGRVPVMAACTHNSTREAVRRVKRIAAIEGVSCILSASPYYSKPTQQGQYLHFKTIAEAIGELPLMLYNIPGRTAVNLEPATMVELAKIPNVMGVKESSGNMAQIGEVLATRPDNFVVFSGDDYMTLPVIAGGGAGLISVASNVAPKAVKAVVAHALNGELEAAREAAKAVNELNRVLFAEPNPAPTKALLAMMQQIASDTLRLPMTSVNEKTCEQVRQTASRLHLL